MNGDRPQLTGIKGFLNDFPNQNGGVVVALILILATGAVVISRLAVGKPFPDGYDGWLIFLGTLAGVSTVGMIGKRATDKEYAMAKRAPKVDNGGSGLPAGTSAYPVQVATSEAPAPLTHRESERGDG